MLKINKIIILLSFAPTLLFGQKLRISIFNDFSISSAVFTVFEGKYQLEGDSVSIKEFKSGDLIYLTIDNNKIKINDRNGELGRFNNVSLKGLTASNYFKLLPVNPQYDSRLYDDQLYIKIDVNKLLFINIIEMDDYLAGVVQTECGLNRHKEFYKAAAIISRTFAIRNLSNHSGEGYWLCDGVHCQAYKSRTEDNDIHLAVQSTYNEVLVAKDSNLITAAFHSNCGGETENSENVWFSANSYLRSVSDPHCTQCRNASWTKKIKVEEWRSYLTKQNCDVTSNSNNDFNFWQSTRKKEYTAKNISIPLKKIRTDWNLKSSFFSLVAEQDMLVFKGRGYGHGVGLCQEGAMEMAKKNYSFTDILYFYYKGVKLVNYESFFGKPIFP